MDLFRFQPIAGEGVALPTNYQGTSGGGLWQFFLDPDDFSLVQARLSGVSASHNGRGLRLCGFLTASTGLQRRCTPCRAHFQRSQPLIFWPLAYSTRTPPLAASHGAAMRSLARFMFIAIATN